MTSPSPETLLFVYGTLKQASSHPMACFLRRHSRFRTVGWLPGRLYDLGHYPGLCYEPAAQAKVAGEIFELTDPEQILNRLDDYEGIACSPDDEYVRTCLPVETTGAALRCWVYVLKRLPSDAALVRGGVWIP